ncbi:MAG: hypothetical protein WC956_08930 [bacterium]
MFSAGKVQGVGLKPVIPAELRAEVLSEGKSESGSSFEVSSGRSEAPAWRTNSLLARRGYDNGAVSPEMREKIEGALESCSKGLTAELGGLGEDAGKAIAGIFREMMDLGLTPPVG